VIATTAQYSISSSRGEIEDDNKMEKTNNKRPSKAEPSAAVSLVAKQPKAKKNCVNHEPEGTTDAGVFAAVLSDPSLLSNHVFCFLDIPTLGSCAQVSKDFRAAAMKDAVWESHLVLLFEKVFDRAFSIEPNERQHQRAPVPISKRHPLKSTTFREWYTEWCSPPLLYYTLKSTAVQGHHINPDNGQEISIDDMTGNETFYHWLVEDVPLRTFYKEAGHFAWLGKHMEDLQESGDDDDDLIDYDGVYLGVTQNMFRGLPNLRLFHGHY